MRPKVLVLDEPTAGLDPKGRDDILDQIAYLHKQSDMTVILVSHSMEDIARYADRIIVMNKGSVMYNGAPKRGICTLSGTGKNRTCSSAGDVCHA